VPPPHSLLPAGMPPTRCHGMEGCTFWRDFPLPPSSFSAPLTLGGCLPSQDAHLRHIALLGCRVLRTPRNRFCTWAASRTCTHFTWSTCHWMHLCLRMGCLPAPHCVLRTHFVFTSASPACRTRLYHLTLLCGSHLRGGIHTDFLHLPASATIPQLFRNCHCLLMGRHNYHTCARLRNA